MNIILNLIKLGSSIALTYNVIKGNIQMATFIGVCIILLQVNNLTRK